MEFESLDLIFLIAFGLLARKIYQTVKSLKASSPDKKIDSSEDS